MSEDDDVNETNRLTRGRVLAVGLSVLSVIFVTLWCLAGPDREAWVAVNAGLCAVALIVVVTTKVVTTKVVRK